MDYKTGSIPREAYEAKALFQLKFYALVLWRTRGVVPRQLRLLYLKDAEACDYAPDAEELARFERTLVALWRAIAATSGDPAIGLKLGGEACLEHNDPAAIAALCSQSFGDAVVRMARYKQLTCPEEIRTGVVRDEVAVEFVWLLAEEEEPDVLVDVCLSWILGIGRRGTLGV